MKSDLSYVDLHFTKQTLRTNPSHMISVLTGNSGDDNLFLTRNSTEGFDLHPAAPLLNDALKDSSWPVPVYSAQFSLYLNMPLRIKLRAIGKPNEVLIVSKMSGFGPRLSQVRQMLTRSGPGQVTDQKSQSSRPEVCLLSRHIVTMLEILCEHIDKNNLYSDRNRTGNISVHHPQVESAFESGKGPGHLRYPTTRPEILFFETTSYFVQNISTRTISTVTETELEPLQVIHHPPAEITSEDAVSSVGDSLFLEASVARWPQPCWTH
ncbi:hypothetical protein RRG08_040204 [Elysia crispata]|uniref:Uncharacterized protein n=1 Tax=Elysia crispata TaxID=231223 RepID=A0AAE1CNQ7_9GAST|nr:hypothetical protein RRG08_040204 [Elysia crispata]